MELDYDRLDPELTPILDVLPAGSYVDEDAFEFDRAGFFNRPMNLPIHVGP